MIEKMLSVIDAKFPLTEADTGDFQKLKANGMKFSIRAYTAEGLGWVSVMTASGFFGLMKMDTLIINPTDVDMPLLSYDRVHAMGNDTLIFELYDTLVGDTDLAKLEEVKQQAKYLPDHDLGAHWYDSIKLAGSISKKGKRAQTPELDALTYEHFEAYLNTPAADTADKAQKRERSASYVDGLLRNGGPPTKVFQKTLGEDATAKLFRLVLFGTGRA